MSAERGATPGAPDGGMETPEACVERMWSTPGYADEVAIAAIRARDEEWARRVQQAHAQGWADCRDAAAAVADTRNARAAILALRPPRA